MCQYGKCYFKDITERYSQDRETVVAEKCNLLIPSGYLVGGRITPRVVIESKEITSLIISAAVHILGSLVTVGCHVRSGIAYRNLSVTTVSDVLLHVTSDSFYIWRSNC